MSLARIKCFVWSSVLFVTFTPLLVQAVDYQKTYAQAKDELKNKNFDKAMDLFKKAAVDKPENPQRVNASYFYAYCALKTKQYWSANFYLSKIIEKYPDWNKINEVYYLQTQLSLEKHEYTQAIATSQKAKSKFLKTDIDNMKWSFLFFPSLKDTVVQIQKRFSTDTCVANILYNLLKDETEWKWKKLRKTLVEKYKLGEDTKTDEKVQTVVSKDTLNIAVMLPFDLKDNLKDHSIKNNLYVFDLYSGMRLAVDSMRRSGAKIRLTAYDYGKDSSEFYDLIDQPELKNYDILIGPLQNMFSSKVSSFAKANKILVINPLSTNLKFTEGSDWVYLMKPSTETQTKESATFAYQYFKPKKALIISGKNAKDSANALLFENSFEDAGGQVLGKTILTVGTLGKLSTLFTKRTLDSTGFIFISSKDQNLGVNIVRKITEMDYNTPLLVYPDWLDFQSISYQQMQKQNIHFIAPEYINYQNDTMASVSDYLQWNTHSLPSQYTYDGFELIYQLCVLAKKDASFFAQPNLKGKKLSAGLLQKGFDFSKGKDNRSFGIYSFTEQGFVEANLNKE